MARQFLLIAAVLGFFGVAFGAFGAHGLAATLEANGREDTFRTATQYHMYHALTLIGVAWLATRTESAWVRRAGWLLTSGAIIFAGSLYILAIFDLGFMGAVAPIGGVLMLAGWGALGMVARELTF